MTPLVLAVRGARVRLLWTGTGYTAEDPDGLAGTGLLVATVAGTSHFALELAADAFAPGRSVTFAGEPDNPFDPNAVAVLDAGGTLQAGYVPSRLGLEIVDAVEEGDDVGGIVLAERHDRGGRRIGIDIVFGVGMSVTA